MAEWSADLLSVISIGHPPLSLSYRCTTVPEHRQRFGVKSGCVLRNILRAEQNICSSCELVYQPLPVEQIHLWLGWDYSCSYWWRLDMGRVAPCSSTFIFILAMAQLPTDWLSCDRNPTCTTSVLNVINYTCAFSTIKMLAVRKVWNNKELLNQLLSSVPLSSRGL